MLVTKMVLSGAILATATAATIAFQSSHQIRRESAASASQPRAPVAAFTNPIKPSDAGAGEYGWGPARAVDW